jgi:hypothetical protein
MHAGGGAAARRRNGAYSCGQAQRLQVELKRATGATVKGWDSRCNYFGRPADLAPQSRPQVWPLIDGPRSWNLPFHVIQIFYRLYDVSDR